MWSTVDMVSDSMIYIPSFRKTGSDIQVILIDNLRSCSVGITNDRDVLSSLLIWSQVA
jgi:hypothetical protein